MGRGLLYAGLTQQKKIRIKSVSYKYSCDEAYFQEFDKGKMLKCSLLRAVLPRNRLDSKILHITEIIGIFKSVSIPNIEKLLRSQNRNDFLFLQFAR